jgi:glycyl-tRNA synthetase beta chain
MKPLLLEIGTEEIPAGYIQPALDALERQLAAKLTDKRIDHGAIKTFGTPRRLVATVEAVAEKQPSVTREVLGPPERAAYDANGKPTLAAEKFAEKLGVALSKLRVAETDKGRYLAVTMTEKGLATKTVLKTLLPDVILGLPFPKTMRWSDLAVAFARPIQSIVALLGESVVPFTLGGRIKSGRHAWGHMFMNHRKIKIDHAGAYVETMRQAQVYVDIEMRKTMVREQVAEAAAAMGGTVLQDEALVDIVANLVEIPIASAGRYDQVFLELPPEILITAMREHQKYFAVTDGNGKLMPCFVAVNNTHAKDMALVAKGHERVLRARLSDARFFYQADIREKMDDWHQKLEGVLFQAKLGSMLAKSRRVELLGGYLAGLEAPEVKDHVMRAAQLCKADLVSQVVYEFTNLQGIMGRTYAKAAGEADEVAAAIEEHYRPTYSGGPLPRTRTGALLALADKLDTLCGCFSVGLIPTGAADPYALRRQCIGVIQIMLDQNFSFSLNQTLLTALEPFDNPDKQEVAQAVENFFRSRVDNLLADDGFAKDVITSVTSISIDHMPNVRQRVEALQDLKGAPDFVPLAAAFKRVVNILRKVDTPIQGAPDPSLFRDSAEKALSQAHAEVKAQVDQQLAQGDLKAALRAIATLRPAVDGFFEDVMVMADDPALKQNRLSLLQSIAALFDQIADFSKIAT